MIVPVFDSNLAAQVLGLLHSWSSKKNNFNLRWTAIAAYGGYVGLRFPEAALRDLMAIASSEEPLLFYAVVESVINLFTAGKFVPNHYLTVLSFLEQWTASTKTTILKELGLLIFWQLLRQEQNISDQNNNYLPTLLWLAMKSQVYEEIIIALLQRGLNFKPTRQLILKEIHNYLKLADEQSRLFKVLGRIIYTLVDQGTERDRTRIIYKLEQWALQEPPNSASEILAIIKKHLKLN